MWIGHNKSSSLARKPCGCLGLLICCCHSVQSLVVTRLLLIHLGLTQPLYPTLGFPLPNYSKFFGDIVIWHLCSVVPILISLFLYVLLCQVGRRIVNTVFLLFWISVQVSALYVITFRYFLKVNVFGVNNIPHLTF